LVVGVSGGIDSATVSSLCAETGLPTNLVVLPIRQNVEETIRANNLISILQDKYENVTKSTIELSEVFKLLDDTLSMTATSELASANVRSRLRMISLYHLATTQNGIVVGTGNKVEDYGVGFFTKYGDGGVDISPIADLYKTEVRELGKYLGVTKEILDAKPTDGLWSDGRSDEDQIGASYEELEWAMEIGQYKTEFSSKENEVMKIYESWHKKNIHKMRPIPTFRV
jgi:NAD+ synthase